MTPFYFGRGRQRLFGVYEPAALMGRAGRAAVVCPPFGDEYLHAHRTLRQLAVRLSGAGVHTLRFDFFGTGDSAGELADADLAGWESDIHLAMEELRDMAGATRVSLIGLRLGATLAARAAALRPNDIDSLVLWDPILSGRDYLAGLGAAAGRPLAIHGLPLTPKMLGDLGALVLRPPFAPPGVRALTLLTDLRAQTASDELARDTGAGDAIEFMTAIRPWIEDPNNAGAVPVGVIQRITDWFG